MNTLLRILGGAVFVAVAVTGLAFTGGCTGPDAIEPVAYSDEQRGAMDLLHLGAAGR